MQSTYLDDDQHRDVASLVPEWRGAVEDQSNAVINDHLASSQPSIVGRVSRAFARFSIAVLIGVGATLAWQSYRDSAREALSTQIPSLRWLSVSTGTVTPDAQRSEQNTAAPQSAPPPQTAAPVAVSIPEWRNLNLWSAISLQCGIA
jgi:hypothetical protein